jgi:hypothetical protein
VGGQHLRDSSKCVEDGPAGWFIGLLIGGKSGFINAIVKVRHQPKVDRVNLGAEFWWIEVKRLLRTVRRKIVIENCVQHSHDIFRFVVHNPIGFLVPEERDRELVFTTGFIHMIDFTQGLEWNRRSTVAPGYSSLVAGKSHGFGYGLTISMGR